MLDKWMDALSAPKSLRHYTGRHRAPRTRRRAYFPVPPTDPIR
jgi:hypothetical protein